MAMPASERTHAAASAVRDRQRPIRHLLGTVVRRRPGELEVALAHGGIHQVRVGRRTMMRLAGHAMTRADGLRLGASVRVAYIDTDMGPLAVLVELLESGRAAGSPKRGLGFAVAPWMHGR
jgi:hypothetical protein